MLKEHIKIMKAAFPPTIPIMMGYLFMGAAFGVLLSEKGYGPGWALFMSVIIFAGAMQFVAVGLLASGASLLTCAAITWMVNIRHVFYGLSLLQKFQHLGWKKWYLIFSLTDETFSLHCSAKAPSGLDEGLFHTYMAGLNHIYWIAGCVAGNVVGPFFPFPSKGVDFAMTALFVVIFVDQWKTMKNHFPALTGSVLSLLCLIIFGPQRFILPSMVGIVWVLIAVGGPQQKRKWGKGERL